MIHSWITGRWRLWISRGAALALGIALPACTVDADLLDEPSTGEAAGAVTCLTVENIGSTTTLVDDAQIVSDPVDPTRAITNYGAIPLMNTGFSATDRRRILLKFDVAGAGVPAGSTVTSATMTMRMSQSLGKNPVDVYAATIPWNETTVTWSQMAAAPSGGLGAFQSTIPTLGVPSGASISATLSADLVTTWIDPALNYGVVLDHPLAGRTALGASEAGPASRPSLQVCYVSPTCSDGTQNQGEAGVDCGGPCPTACATCSDGLQNQGETAVDCGGPCLACPDGWAIGATSDVNAGFSQVADLVADAAGNTYTTGYFYSSLDLGNGPVYGSQHCDWYDGCFPGTNFFVVKYDPTGVLQWFSPYGYSDDEDLGTGIAVDSNGDVFALMSHYDYYDWWWSAYSMVVKISGTTGQWLWYSYLEGVGGDVTVTSAGDVVVVLDPAYSWEVAYASKLDGATGTPLWATTLSATGDVSLRRVAVDGAGQVAITGTFGTTLALGPTLTAQGSSDVFVARLDAAGTPLWATSFGAPGVAQDAGDILADAAGNTFLSATVAGTISVAGGPVLAAHGGSDVLLAKIDPAGTHVWSQRLGGAGDESAGRVVLDNASVFGVTGTFNHGADFGGGPMATDYPTTFLASYDSSGAFRSQRDLRFVTVAGLGVDAAGRLYAGGSSLSDANLGFGPLPDAPLSVIALNTPPASSPGSCASGAYCDGVVCQPPSSPMSMLACSCGNLDPACGIGTCGGGAYCEGGGCASPECFAPGSPEARAMCGGGVVSNACTVTGGTRHVFTTSVAYNGDMGFPAQWDPKLGIHVT